MNNYLISTVMEKMIAGSDGNLHDINHFLKVWGFARTIGELEKLDEETQSILEIAAIIHDIACPLCRIRYGNTDGKNQEKESEPLVREFLKQFELSDEKVERIVYLVTHHHTYENVLGMDYQILLEADFLVNADESHYTKDIIQNFKKNVFRTKSGIQLLENMYA